MSMPTVFLSHGSPMLILEDRPARAFLAAGGCARPDALPHAQAIHRTFVARRESERSTSDLSRREIRDQITALEAALARLPPPPVLAEPRPRPTAAALLSTEELLDVRNRLVERLEQLDTERTVLIESLEQLGVEARPSRRATPSLAGARIRWVGG